MQQADRWCVWENQRRHTFIGWTPTEAGALIYSSDPPAWQAADGHELARPPDAPYYHVMPCETSDIEGWEYSTTFERITQERPGGRASERTTDWVRRRRWIRRQPLQRIEMKGLDVLHEWRISGQFW